MLRRGLNRRSTYVILSCVIVGLIALTLLVYFLVVDRKRYPRLEYDTNSGGSIIRTRSSYRPTVSVYWDLVAQDLSIAERRGPTVTSGAFVVLHTAIFYAWTNNETVNFPSRRPCVFRRVAANHAAYFSLLRTYGDRKKRRLLEHLNDVVGSCKRDVVFQNAVRIGSEIARQTMNRYNREVIVGFGDVYNYNSTIEHWIPERIPIDDTSGPLQTYLTKSWWRRYTFGLRNGAQVQVPPPEPFLLMPGVVDVQNRTVQLQNGTLVRFSSGLVGQVINSGFIKQAERVLEASKSLTAEEKFIAEFWEQGGGTSYPPGCWMKLAEFISARNKHTQAQDVRLFFALSNALSDAAISTWYVKRYYNYTRPVRAIRTLGALGLLGSSVEYFDVECGGRVMAPAASFITYQNPRGEPSPPFPEYTSGHSAFSAAAAEVLRSWTGTDRLDVEVTLKARGSRFEPGRAPLRDVKLKWKTYSEAAEQAGISRIYGGIHFDDANVEGARLGRFIARKVLLKAEKIWSEQDKELEST